MTCGSTEKAMIGPSCPKRSDKPETRQDYYETQALFVVLPIRDRRP